jgi:hypothetical protein
MPKKAHTNYSRYVSIASLMKLAKLSETLFGIKMKNYSAYAKFDIGILIQSSLGSTFVGSIFKPGWTYQISYFLNLTYIPSDLELIYEELGENFEITINGNPLKIPGEPEFIYDRSNRVISGISSYLHIGKNQIVIRSNIPNFLDMTPSTHGLEPILLRGSFLVKKKKIIAIPSTPIIGTGNWVQKGFPFLSQGMVYSITTHIDYQPAGMKSIIKFPLIESVMSIKLNGQSCGALAWPPYEFDISQALIPGDNQIEITIYNTMANLLSKPLPSGLLKPAVLELEYPSSSSPN